MPFENKILLDAAEKFENQYNDVFYQRPLKVVKHFHTTVHDFYHHQYDDQQRILLLIFKAIAIFYFFRII